MPPVSEHWARVKEVFDAAADLAPHERATLLHKECDGDTALRREVESLLASDAQTDGFIEQPVLEMPRDLFPQLRRRNRSLAVSSVPTRSFARSAAAVWVRSTSPREPTTNIARRSHSKSSGAGSTPRTFSAVFAMSGKSSRSSITRALRASSTVGRPMTASPI